jgi:pyruvate-formate lyase-activating enzyme
MKRADIKVGFSCNNHCLFCVQGEKRKKVGDKTLREIKKELKQAIMDCQEVVLTGGEPTIRPDFLEIVSFAKKLGFITIQIQSNGRMFSYQDFCEKLIKAGANEFSPALHGHIPELHDYLTNSKGSFQQTVQGIKNLKKLGQKVVTNTVVTKSNYRHLPEIAQLLINLGVDQYQFAFVHPLGSAFKNFESIIPRMTLIEPFVKKGLDVGIEKNKIVMTEAIPYCFMQGYENYVAERIIPETKIFDYQKVDENFTRTRQTEGKAKGPRCQECLHNKICEGPWREYPEKFGWEEFIPVKNDSGHADIFLRTIKQSFDFLISKNKLSKHKTIICDIEKILFSGFDANWLLKNQKFDFSVSSEKNSLRFSYNNFGEKKFFRKKLLDIFTLFGKTYAVAKLKRLLNIMMFDEDKHQTTFGIEWLREDELPRIKVYFEELFNVYSNETVIGKLKEICFSLRIRYDQLGIGKEERVGAICIDFFPSGSTKLKVYFLKRKMDGKKLTKIIESLKSSGKKELLNQFLESLTLEKRAFFYETKRFSETGNLSSLKLYKIYEVNQIADNFERAWKEIKRFLRATGKAEILKQISPLEKICRKNKMNLYPVIASIDNSSEAENVDLYFSFR